MDNRAVVSCFNGFLRRIQHFIFASYWSKEQVQLHSGRQRYKPTGIFSLAKWRVLPSIFRIWRPRLSNRKRVRQNHSRCRWTESRLSWSGSCSAVRNVCCLFIWLIEWLDFRHGNGRLRVRCLLIRSVNSAYANGKQIKTYPLFQHGTRNNQHEKRLSWYANLENWYLVYPFIFWWLILGWRITTLASIRKFLLHSYRSIDYLKIDIEGDEWPFLEQMLQDGHSFLDIKQIGMEVHLLPFDRLDHYRSLIQRLESLGYVRFFSRQNRWMTHAYEMAWFNANYSLNQSLSTSMSEWKKDESLFNNKLPLIV